ncbi:MAG: exodeoxyribonuclease VII small subunit [Oscillospiraceae bacterium]|jgi:exodeoxyribonuclease VII small subunit|nr:exodeoxyribonuclease VII small subunit [Oscillospiraceae bacterium]
MKSLTYEQAMEKLEQAVARLHEGALSLEETLAVYDDACRLAVHCGAQLENAKQKLTLITDGVDL